jgi:acyl-coenzyme A synthetase/AMP-(fatty) acid ligase
MDERGEPCAPGETGEIVMESPFLSHGYLSADRAPAPLSRYRTGDRGHRPETGLLHVVGRLDREVKIRGVRVNLDEVGAVLSSHPLVDSAVVITGTDPAGGLRLEAHIAMTGGAAPTGRDLRHYLASRLPDQMLPATYHVASQLPLGATGKVSARVLESRTAQRTGTGER